MEGLLAVFLGDNTYKEVRETGGGRDEAGPIGSSGVRCSFRVVPIRGKEVSLYHCVSQSLVTGKA